MSKQLLWPSVIVVGLVVAAGAALLAALCISAAPAGPAEVVTPAALAAVSIASPAPTSTDTETASETPTEAATETSTPTQTPTPTEIPPAATPTATTTATRPTSTPTRTSTPAPTRAPTQTPLPSGRSELQNNELASAAIVGNLDPKRSLPAEIGDCHWQQKGDPRIVCHVQVFLPPGYFDGARRYPVLYLLHGWGGWDTNTHDSEWNDKYKLFIIADSMMRAGQIPPLIIVVPEGGHTYWFNHAVDNERWGDYVASEVVNYVDANFRTLPRRESRAIGGLSMGGLGAIQLALNHPGEFSAVGMRSPTFRRSGDPDEGAFFGDASYYANYDPFVLVNRSNAVNQFALYILSGDRDIWLERTQQFRGLLDQKHAAYEWHVYPGGHDGVFFGSHLDEELLFYGAHLATK